MAERNRKNLVRSKTVFHDSLSGVGSLNPEFAGRRSLNGLTALSPQQTHKPTQEGPQDDGASQSPGSTEQASGERPTKED